MRKYITILIIAVLVLVVRSVMATQPEKLLWCHVAESGVQNTLELPQQALENAGHVDAGGNPLHAGDHAGACEEPTPTTEITPTVEPTIEVTPTATPSATLTPKPSDEGNKNSDGGGHVSDGLTPRGGQPMVSAFDGKEVGWK